MTLVMNDIIRYMRYHMIPVSLRESISFSRLDRVLCNRPYSRPPLISLFKASVTRCSLLDIRSSHLSPDKARLDCDNSIQFNSIQFIFQITSKYMHKVKKETNKADDASEWCVQDTKPLMYTHFYRATLC